MHHGHQHGAQRTLLLFVLPVHPPLAKVFPGGRSARLYTCSAMVFLMGPHGTRRATPDQEPEHHVISLCDLGRVSTSFGPHLPHKQNRSIMPDVPSFHFFPFQIFYDTYS